MQMRNCALWLSVIGVFAFVSTADTAWAAPKKKHKKAKAVAAASADPEPVEEEKVKDVDDLMNDTTKKKPVSKAAAAPEPEPEREAEVAEPDAWERPPLEKEKPKRRKAVAVIEEEKKGDDRAWNLGIFAGYGFQLGGTLTSLNAYSLGFGIQLDYELENHLVLGLGGEYFIGGNDDTRLNSQGLPETDYANYILGHVNVGYNFWFGTKVFLRPSVWVGTAMAIRPKRAPTLDGLEVDFMLAPGASFHYLMGENGWYLGADARFVLPFGTYSNQALSILVTAGKRF